jgi:signal transduction histidine kinase
MRAPIRTALFLQALALAAAAAALLLAIGLPLAAAGRLRAPAVTALALAAGGVVALLGTAILFRWVARPVERLLAAAERLGSGEGLPVLAPPGEPPGPGLARAAVAFERVVASLAAERGHLAAKVAELEAANCQLADTRESLLRSERLATVGRLAAGLAHEVGNPLGAIAGYAELARGRLAASAPGPEVDDFVARIGAEAARIDRTVRDLLDFARPATAPLGRVDLPAAVDAALRLARVQARFKGVAVRLALAPELPPVIAEERRLAQVLLNLLLNAGDAMRGAGEVEIRADVPDDGQVELTVADQGPGIAPEDLPRVFDPFFTTKAPGQGTGLGLAICHGIMASFGGEIGAGPGARGGAVFRLRFRAAEPSAPAP